MQSSDHDDEIPGRAAEKLERLLKDERGRPTRPELQQMFEEITELVASGASIRQACRQVGDAHANPARNVTYNSLHSQFQRHLRGLATQRAAEAVLRDNEKEFVKQYALLEARQNKDGKRGK